MKGSTIALLSRAFINDSDDARKTPAEPFFEMAKAAGGRSGCTTPGWIQRRRRTPRRGSRGI